jgi:hypothetical protein
MANLERPKQRRGLVAVDGAMALISHSLNYPNLTSLETFLAGHTGAVLPAAIFSGLVFFGCLAVDLFVTRVDEGSRKP